MKKIFILSLLAFLGFVPHVLAQFVPLAPIPGLTDPTALGSTLDADTLAKFFNNLYKYLIGLAATLAVIEIIWGGLEISTKDSVSKQSDGKERITQAIFGLVLVLSPVLVFSIINPSILNLSLNLPPIDLTVSATAVSTTVIPGTPLGAGVKTYACTGSDSCQNATALCNASCDPTTQTPQSSLECLKSDGTINSTTRPNGYVCSGGETLVVSCLCTTN